MPRRAEIQPRQLAADPVYDSTLVTQLVNRIMTRGKKSTAEQIVYDALDARRASAPASRRSRCSSRP